MSKEGRKSQLCTSLRSKQHDLGYLQVRDGISSRDFSGILKVLPYKLTTMFGLRSQRCVWVRKSTRGEDSNKEAKHYYSHHFR